MFSKQALIKIVHNNPNIIDLIQISKNVLILYLRHIFFVHSITIATSQQFLMVSVYKTIPQSHHKLKYFNVKYVQLHLHCIHLVQLSLTQILKSTVPKYFVLIFLQLHEHCANVIVLIHSSHITLTVYDYCLESGVCAMELNMVTLKCLLSTQGNTSIYVPYSLAKRHQRPCATVYKHQMVASQHFLPKEMK